MFKKFLRRLSVVLDIPRIPIRQLYCVDNNILKRELSSNYLDNYTISKLNIIELDKNIKNSVEITYIKLLRMNPSINNNLYLEIGFIFVIFSVTTYNLFLNKN